uniref:PspA/IM30 family protein n=1 Tax=Chlamydomonas leiostraca TaxID=1034604 RepID=A0A7S0WW75_9CHLO|mmetsp:Transcript_30569/g.78007  ORF Transcript_30569/g.78007 Transcript_30569/m.78007 type:complete len:302 (+) Transcript_30569:161-1066(+)
MQQAVRMSRSMASSSGRSLVAAPARPTGPVRSRKTVVVQANLFARVTRLISSYANNIVTTAEDPEKLLDQVVNEMQEDLIKMRQAAAQVMASQKQLEAKYKQAQMTADDWLRRAELAVGKGEDDLAKEALKRRKSYQENADQMKMQLEQQQKATDQLLANTRMLEAKLAEAKSKKETLKARAASAKTSKQIQEMVGSLNTSNAVVAFDKMEEKVMALEAEAQSTSALASPDALEARFAALEGSSGVEDDLAVLKQAARTGQPGSLPLPRFEDVVQGQGQAQGVRSDAIEAELRELRRRARE